MRFCNGVLLISFLFLLPFISQAQYQAGRLSDLYRYVEQTDSLLHKSQQVFFLEKFLKDDHNYRETWRYTTNGGRIVYFQVDYILDSTEFTEVYYLQRNNVVCSEEYEKINYSDLEDKLAFGGIYYFQSNAPQHIVTLGSSSRQTRFADPGSLALTRFEKRFSELKRHLPMLPR